MGGVPRPVVGIGIGGVGMCARGSARPHRDLEIQHQLFARVDVRSQGIQVPVQVGPGRPRGVRGRGAAAGPAGRCAARKIGESGGYGVGDVGVIGHGVSHVGDGDAVTDGVSRLHPEVPGGRFFHHQPGGPGRGLRRGLERPVLPGVGVGLGLAVVFGQGSGVVQGGAPIDPAVHRGAEGEGHAFARAYGPYLPGEEGG